LAISGFYVYLGDGYGGFKVVDISNPAAPRVVGQCSSVSGSVVVRGFYGYVTGVDSYGLAALYVVDLSDPTNPNLLDTVSMPGKIGGIAATGNCVYVADADRRLCFHVVDVSNPFSPTIVASSSETPWGSGHSGPIMVDERFAYVVHEEELSLWDISNPFNAQLRTWVSCGPVSEMYATRNNIFVTVYYSPKLYIYANEP
jgi:hypothetical protein